MMIQVFVYLFMFVIPYFLLTHTTLDSTYLTICVYMSISGAIFMFSYEIIAIVVEGPKIYFSDPWNWIDAMTLPLYLILSSINLYIEDNVGASDHDLI